MSAVLASLCFTLLFFGVFLFASADQKIITAESGQDVTLTCRAPSNNFIVVKWSRADLVDEYVLLYQDDQFDRHNQHPSFKNRVDLQDRQMKDGDVSLILKDVTINDAGTYECGVAQREPNQERPSLKPISIIHLHVDPPDKKIITAESGQNVTLTCRAPNNIITAVEWSRADLWPKNVFLYQDGHFGSANQHQSFKNRVDLQDRQMKDGDVSLILKDVTINDTGTYVCRVCKEETRSWEIINSTHLIIDPGKSGGYPGWMIALIICGVLLGILLLLLVIYWIYTKKQKKRKKCCKQVRNHVRYSPPNSDPSAAVPRSPFCRRKEDDQGQEETDDAS